MVVNTNLLIPMTEANQNFSKVARMADKNGLAVILKNSKPRYVIVAFNEPDEICLTKQARRQTISSVSDDLIAENIEAFKELAK